MEKIPILTISIFQMGWNHQLECNECLFQGNQQRSLNQYQLGRSIVDAETDAESIRSVGFFQRRRLEASNAYDEHLAHHVNKIHSYFTGKSEAERFLESSIFLTQKKLCRKSPHFNDQFQFQQDVQNMSQQFHPTFDPLVLVAMSAEATWPNLKSLWLFRGPVILVRKGNEGKGKFWGP